MDLIDVNRRVNTKLKELAVSLFSLWFKTVGETEIVRIGDIFTYETNGRLYEPDPDGLPYLRIETYRTDRVEDRARDKGGIVDYWDVVLVKDGCSGEVFRFKRGILGSTMLKLKQISYPADMRNYIYIVLLGLERELAKHKTGTALPHLDKHYLFDLKIRVPRNPEKVRELNEMVEPLFRLIIRNKEENELLQRF